MESGSKKSSSFVEQTRKASRVEGESRKKDESKLDTENDEPSSISTTANAQAEVGTETEIGSEVEIGTVTEIGDPAMDESEQEAMLDHNYSLVTSCPTEVEDMLVDLDESGVSQIVDQSGKLLCLFDQIEHFKAITEAIM